MVDFNSSVSNVPSKAKVYANFFAHTEYIYIQNGTYIENAWDSQSKPYAFLRSSNEITFPNNNAIILELIKVVAKTKPYTVSPPKMCTYFKGW